MSELTLAHIEQIKVMRGENQPYLKIKEFFKSTYGIKLTQKKIDKAEAGLNPQQTKKRARRQRKELIKNIERVAREEGIDPNAPDELSGDFVESVRAAFAEFKKKSFLRAIEKVISTEAA